jgi:hypothetical protein
MPLSERCENIIQVINTLFLIAGIITGGIGVSMIPQNITNNGNLYIGSAEQYQAELRSAQLSSYGFKLTMAGLIGVLYSIVAYACMHGYRNIECKRNAVADSVPPQASSKPEPKPLKSILKDTSDYQLQLNIKKWTGTVTPEDIV